MIATRAEDLAASFEHAARVALSEAGLDLSYPGAYEAIAAECYVASHELFCVVSHAKAGRSVAARRPA